MTLFLLILFLTVLLIVMRCGAKGRARLSSARRLVENSSDLVNSRRAEDRRALPHGSFSPRKVPLRASSRGHRHARLLKTCYDMHLSPSFRGVVLSLVLALAATLFSSAQTPYSLGAGEFPIAGSLAGDQVHPHLSLNSSGGFLVWEDNAADPYGMGLKAAALDSNLSRAGSPFRVNKNGAGDQEHPRVALLNGGVFSRRTTRG